MTGHGGWPLNVFLTPDQAAVLRRHLLAAGAAATGCRASARCSRRSPTSGSERREEAVARRRARWQRGSGARRRSSPRARRSSAALLERALAGAAQRASTRATAASAARRSSRRTARSSCSRRSASARCRHGDAARDGARRDLRPGRRRLRALRGRRHLDGPALREDALRQRAARARLPAGPGRTQREPLFERTCRETLEFCLREMRAPEGGFYSSLDADSEGVEGRFYVWTLGAAARRCSASSRRPRSPYFGASEHGNFEGANVLEARGPGAGGPRARSARGCSRPARSACARRSTTSAWRRGTR